MVPLDMDNLQVMEHHLQDSQDMVPHPQDNLGMVHHMEGHHHHSQGMEHQDNHLMVGLQGMVANNQFGEGLLQVLIHRYTAGL
ncbi:hypothetical protein KUTeg_000695 [Tegillarca granosa]|uniref:Uncharacterized protein n=1 Tax=Tegillarca granosa TaxID=220873 RepID=A0ABQ9FYA2_TEGGR|nr:hypothetical protein KUTeg_000695 [Tegillarca granosa]